MSFPVQMNQVWNKAFDLAYFICPDYRIARDVASNAFLKLEVAAAAQNKRLYYRPAKRGAGQPCDVTRTKISLREDHLLQRLIYIESEPHERLLEADGSANDEEMIVHFVKHLARITIRRNSFYVALGLCRLLYDYSTAEAMEIYNVVVQDPERVKDDYYYRSRKARLVDEIKDRFGEIIQLTRGARGEERIQSGELNRERISIVLDCLRRFVPWETKCILPSNFDPTSVEVPGLLSGGGETDETVEINRVHSLFDPLCYEVLVKALRLDEPSEKLRVPKFCLQKGGNDLTGDGNDRRRPPRVTNADLEDVRNRLADQSSRRKRTVAGVMSVVVDGVEYARLDPGKTSNTLVTVRSDAELVEVYALRPEGKLLMATHFLNLEEQFDRPRTDSAKIVLEGGQKLTFTVSPEPDVLPNSLICLEVGYKETAPLRWVALCMQRLQTRIAAAGRGAIRLPAIGAALGLLLLSITAAGLWIAFRRQGPNPGKEHVVSVEPTTGVANLGDSHPTVISNSKGSSEITKPEGKNLTPSDNVNRKALFNTVKGFGSRVTLPAPEGRATKELTGSQGSSKTGAVQPGEQAPVESRSIRSIAGGQSNSAVVDLGGVSKVFVEPIGSGESLQELASILKSDVRLASKWTIVDSKDNADAVLKLKDSKRKLNGKGSAAPGDGKVDASTQVLNGPIVVQLVNEDGLILWPIKKHDSAGRYTGKVSDVAGRIAVDLSKDVYRSTLTH